VKTKKTSAAGGLADCPQASLVSRMSLIRDNQQGAIEQRFDLGGRHTVRLALCTVAVVPIESR
jgi:hypothetical protein